MYEVKEGSVGMAGRTSLIVSTKVETRDRMAASASEVRERAGKGRGVLFSEVDRGGGGREGLERKKDCI